MRKFSKEIKKIVIKVGSSSITHKNGALNIEKVDELAREISNLQNKDIKVVLVSSGAIAIGRHKMNIDQRPTEISSKQAIASIGQVSLMNNYMKSFAEFGYSIGQILLTKVVEKDSTMKENAINTLYKLMDMNVIPIVNENDTISTFEIKFGDNDTLSALVATLIDADLLLMLSDIDGLYTDDPNKNKDAKIIKEVNEIDDKLLGLAKDTNSNLGTGGMSTKIKAAKKCMEKGIDVVITNSHNLKNIREIVKGEEIGTIFKK